MRVQSLMFILLPSLVSSTAFPQITQVQFHERVVATYSFSPRDLTSEQRTAKSAEMDKFWQLVKSAPSDLLPFLRIELQDPSCPPFMAYDGSVLLLSLSGERADKEIAGQALGRCDLKDISPAEYLKSVNRLANEGVDVRVAAFKILDEPSFLASVPEHALTLGQSYSFVCALFPMPDSLFVDDCIARLVACNNDTTAATLLLALWYSTTQRGFDAILATVEDSSRSSEVRDYAKMMSEELSALKGKYDKQKATESYEDLKKQRRSSLRGINDERLYEFEDLTQRLQAAFFSKG